MPIPVVILKIIFFFVGKKDVVDRLVSSLEVDITKTKELLGWSPVVSVDDQLKKTVDYFLERKNVR